VLCLDVALLGGWCQGKSTSFAGIIDGWKSHSSWMKIFYVCYRKLHESLAQQLEGRSTGMVLARGF